MFGPILIHLIGPTPFGETVIEDGVEAEETAEDQAVAVSEQAALSGESNGPPSADEESDGVSTDTFHDVSDKASTKEIITSEPFHETQ